MSTLDEQVTQLRSEVTGAEVAKIAARMLADPNVSRDYKRVAASALTQVERVLRKKEAQRARLKVHEGKPVEPMFTGGRLKRALDEGQE